jgi:hypothetical protein
LHRGSRAGALYAVHNDPIVGRNARSDLAQAVGGQTELNGVVFDCVRVVDHQHVMTTLVGRHRTLVDHEPRCGRTNRSLQADEQPGQ